MTIPRIKSEDVEKLLEKIGSSEVEFSMAPLKEYEDPHSTNRHVLVYIYDGYAYVFSQEHRDSGGGCIILNVIDTRGNFVGEFRDNYSSVTSYGSTSSRSGGEVLLDFWNEVIFPQRAVLVEKENEERIRQALGRLAEWKRILYI